MALLNLIAVTLGGHIYGEVNSGREYPQGDYLLDPEFANANPPTDLHPGCKIS